jgi:formiminotetrahydrofolate cyclodeaminase
MGDRVSGLADRRVRETLAALASRAQPPAAGVASALAAAAAAALVELTAGLAADRTAAEHAGAEGRLRALADRAGELREELLASADDDAQAYADVMDAQDAGARARALSRASDPPLAIAECAAEVAEAAAETALAGSWAFTADAVVASSLAMAAAQGGAELVGTNLAGRSYDPRLARARAAAERAERASRAAVNRAAN